MPEPNSGCQLWIGYVNKSNGYGYLTVNGSPCPANRAALELGLGHPLAPGEESCHKCDVRPCIRFEHLFAGTRTDNMRDAARKGRIRGPWSVRAA